MTGTITLQGGNEHTPGCESIDRRLWAVAGDPTPRVVIVPLASSRRTAARTTGLAIEWWTSLGAEVHAIPSNLRPDEEAHSRVLIDRARLIVFTGGVPDRLLGRLQRTPLWCRIVAAWRRGTHLSGSSSGAMVMGGWLQSVRPPFRLRAGLGLVDVAVAPHQDLDSVRAMTRARARAHPWLTILGIDERTALTGRNGEYTVVGAGRVTVFHEGSIRVLSAGEQLMLSAARVPPVQDAATRLSGERSSARVLASG